MPGPFLPHPIGRRLLVPALLALLVAPPARAQAIAGAPPKAALPAADDGQILQLLKSGQFAAAEALLRARIQAAPADPGLKYYLGFCLLGGFRYREAEAVLAQAVAADPGRAEWHEALAKAQNEQARYHEAIASLRRALALSQRAQYHYALAAAAENLGQWKESEAALQAALQLDPGHAEALYRLGRLRENRGDDRAALDLFSRALAGRPAHADARFHRGQVESRLGDAAAAVADFEAVLHAVPGHTGALNGLGRALLASGRQAEGKKRLAEFAAASARADQIDFAREFVRLDPTNLGKRARLIELLLEAGRTPEAADELRSAFAVGSPDARLLRLLAVVQRRAGQPAEAERAEAAARSLEAGQAGDRGRGPSK